MKQAQTYLSFLAFIVGATFVYGISNQTLATRDPDFLKHLDAAVLAILLVALALELVVSKFEVKSLNMAPLILVLAALGVAGLSAGFGWDHGFVQNDNLIVRAASALVLGIIALFTYQRAPLQQHL